MTTERPDRPESSSDRLPDDSRAGDGQALATGIAIGLAIGAGAGVALGSLPIGVGIGLAIGVAIGASRSGRPRR
jgi:hypothetical protein